METDNPLKTYWPHVKEFIRSEWPKFTDVELNRINGDYDQFCFYLKDFYQGFPKTEAIARDKIRKFINSLEDKQFQRKSSF